MRSTTKTKATPKTRGEKKPTSSTKKTPVKKAEPTQKKTVRTRKPKTSDTNSNETVAVSSCTSLKKAIANNKFDDWDEIGFGEDSKMWYQIKGLMYGNNIAISKQDVGRKKRFILYLVSKQGTEVEFEFTEFSYVHKEHKLTMVFSNGKDLVKHIVTYGGING